MSSETQTILIFERVLKEILLAEPQSALWSQHYYINGYQHFPLNGRSILSFCVRSGRHTLVCVCSVTYSTKPKIPTVLLTRWKFV